MNGPERGRREFFKGLARSLGLGALAVLTGALALKKRTATRGHECANGGVCRGCPTFDGCGLPQALSAKKARKRQPCPKKE